MNKMLTRDEFAAEVDAIERKYAMEAFGDPDGIRKALLRQHEEDQKREALVVDAMHAHPKRRGELRAECARRIFAIVRGDK